MKIHLKLPAAFLVLAVAGCGASAANGPRSAPTAVTGLNHIHSIVVMAGNPNELYMGTHYHLYKTVNGGRTFSRLSSLMMFSLALNPTHATTFYAVSAQKGFVKSVDGGHKWSQVTPKIPFGTVTGVVMDPATGRVLAYGSGIFIGGRGAPGWSHVLVNQTVSNVAVGSSGDAYAATANGLFVSHDYGSHWTSVKLAAGQPVVQVTATGPVAYAALPLSVIKTSNAGKSWSTLHDAPQGIEFLGVSASNPKEVFGEVTGVGIVASYNGGSTWRDASNGIKYKDFNASTVRVAPSDAKIVYTGSWGLHFYRSTDAGRHWRQIAYLAR